MHTRTDNLLADKTEAVQDPQATRCYW